MASWLQESNQKCGQELVEIKMLLLKRLNPLNAGGGNVVRLTKIEFPKFDGKDVNKWVFRCEQCSDIDETPEHDNVKIASFHLEGGALNCYQNYLKFRRSTEPLMWKDYVEAISSRFGGLNYEDPIAELEKLRQQGNAED